MWTKQNLKIGTEYKLTLETRKIAADELKGTKKIGQVKDYREQDFPRR